MNHGTPKSQNRACSGQTLVEFLISTLLLVTTGSALLSLANSVLKQKHHLDLSRKDISQRLRLRTLLYQVVDDIDSHRLHLPPIVHHHGHLRNADGSLHPVTHIRGASAPSRRSDILTNIRLRTDASLHVLSTRGSPPLSMEFVACGKYSFPAKQLQDPISFIGISLEGLSYLRGTVLRDSEMELCYQLMLRQTANPILSPIPNSDLQRARMLIPVESYYSLFVDRSNTLRRLSHLSKSGRHHQPLLSKIRACHFEVRSSRHMQGSVVLAKVRTITGRVHPLAATHSLGRSSPRNLLLNWAFYPFSREAIR